MRLQLKNNNYSMIRIASKFLGVPLKIEGHRPAIFQLPRPEVNNNDLSEAA